MTLKSRRAFLFLFGGTSLALAAAGRTALAQTKTQPQDTAYRLGANDKVRINVFGEDDLSGEFEVDGGGNISYPLIGQIAVGGLTIPEVEAKLTTLLKKDYLKQPRVSVEVLTYRPFFILGEVNVPGRYSYVNGMTVINAVAMGGGFSYRADRDDIRISRDTPKGTQKFRATVDTPVLPGDVIEVKDRLF
jgi:polysaccharide export outer membrane protein